MTRILILLVTIVCFSACSSNDSGKTNSDNAEKAQQEKTTERKAPPRAEPPPKPNPDTEDQYIKDYLAKNNIDAKRLESGVYVLIEKEGDGGPKPTMASTVTFDYEGYLLEDGKVFDSSYEKGQPLTYPLQKLIPGWQHALVDFSRGTKGKLFIPSALGYGQRGYPGAIPPNAILGFDIELLDFK